MPADSGIGQVQVHADVEDDAGGAQLGGVEPAQPVARVVEEAELGHEPLGVQRPALGVRRS